MTKATPSHTTTLTAARLRELLHYNPDTGVFTWRVRSDVRKEWNTRYAGKRTGLLYEDRLGNVYERIRLDGKLYRSHRLAWLYMTGEWPSDRVDHKNTISTDNSWQNLRQATQSQNKANCARYANNASGYKGVYRKKSTGRYEASIRVMGTLHCLGTYDDPAEAHAAYCRAAVKHFGEFARTE